MICRIKWIRTNLTILFIVCSLLITAKGLKCYQCFWNDSPRKTTTEELEKLAKIKDRAFPISKHYIGKVDRPRPPNEDEVRTECDRTICQAKDDSCLKWSYISNSPKNITYMCVGNPQKRSGCFRQQLETKELKQYLTIEACLCDTNYCNEAAKISSFNLYMIIILLIFTINYN